MMIDKIIKSVLAGCVLLIVFVAFQAEAMAIPDHIGNYSCGTFPTAVRPYGDEAWKQADALAMTNRPSELDFHQVIRQADQVFTDLKAAKDETNQALENLEATVISNDQALADLETGIASMDIAVSHLCDDYASLREENEELRRKNAWLHDVVNRMRDNDRTFLEETNFCPRANNVAVIKVQSIIWLDADDNITAKAEFIGDENRWANNWSIWGHRTRNVGRQFVFDHYEKEEGIPSIDVIVKEGESALNAILTTGDDKFHQQIMLADVIYLVPTGAEISRIYQDNGIIRIVVTDMLDDGIDAAYNFIGITTITPMTDQALGIDDYEE